MKISINRKTYIYIYMFFSTITTRTSITLKNLIFKDFHIFFLQNEKLKKSLKRRLGVSMAVRYDTGMRRGSLAFEDTLRKSFVRPDSGFA